ncbi:hypothetical protein O7602_14600 [Micromonospora sp. WMMD1128]|uniref:hypothetical protein n=1 Tax=Micromonospora sp. WMMD1128 TaxID=3015150 RepID=UPI00248D0EC3|nr:hypothetical protein [Micromonospora sp. WMMD1128]WBB76684.1 hypothetical protein O7602_14600 [Micromonospora sp. WMMD1128]
MTLRRTLSGTATVTTFVVGMALALATFAFQTTQEWVDEGGHEHAYRWLLPSAVAVVVIAAGSVVEVAYLLTRRTDKADVRDAYHQYAAGVIAYGRILHEQQRDPAVLRLRENSSLTLHVLGFHEQRVELGEWALESAQFVDDKLAIISILIDDLGWANYLLGRNTAVVNIERAIRYGEQLPDGFGEPRRSLLLAKAHRHLGVTRTTRDGEAPEGNFDRAEQLLAGVAALAPHEVRVDLAHVDYARSLAIVTRLGVNTGGSIEPSDARGTAALREALDLVRQAKAGFQAESDQGRYAKSLVLEIRILQAIHEDAEAGQLATLRDRAVAASVWARPAGAAFITGR